MELPCCCRCCSCFDALRCVVWVRFADSGRHAAYCPENVGSATQCPSPYSSPEGSADAGVTARAGEGISRSVRAGGSARQAVLESSRVEACSGVLLGATALK
eukprot:3940578-Rhodomonas_salina.6